MNRTYIISLLILFLLTTCEERERSNPFDPDTDLDPDSWAPSNLQVEVIDDSQIKLTWTQKEDWISGFRISRKAGSGSFTQIAEVDADVTEYTVMGLIVGIIYTYRVKAFTDVNESGYIEITRDCFGEWGGTSVEDCAGDCNGTAVEDCAGECNGTAVEDCSGDCSGTAFENACDNCVGGNTGMAETYCDPITDIDGNQYETVAIGNQVWMAENLKVTHYRNGDVISHLTDNNSWGGTSNGAYCAYNNNEDNVDTYGRLYNWYAVNDSRNIAPEGWHVPTDAEWTLLTDYLGGSNVAGGKLKEAGTEHWNSPNTGATNESGFTAFPGAFRNDYGSYWGMGYYGIFWSSTESFSTYAWYRHLYYGNSDVFRYNYASKQSGYSIRCVRN